MRGSLLARSNRLRQGFVGGALLALLFLGLSFFLPRLLPSNRGTKNLEALRKQAQSIKAEFAALETRLGARLAALASPSFPYDREKIFQLFEGMEINPELEGVAYYDEDGVLALWMGNVVDFRPATADRTLLLRDKASVYLISSRRIRESEQIVFSRLLAFRPRLSAPYLGEYHFLKGNLRQNGHIDYLDFRQDVSGFEAVFARHQDEYLGEPRPGADIQQVFFPLRDARGEIVATVNLSSPSQVASQSRLQESMAVLFAMALAISLVFLIIDLARRSVFGPEKRAALLFLLVLALAGLRFLFLSF
ncbi:MAG: hypothetical protein AB1715_07145, partial [Acidobacteriota bacterium]